MKQIFEKSEYSPSSVKKFYLLEYFYVFLKSVEKFSDKDQVSDSFNALKQVHYLGESKYKKLTFKQETGKRYTYTFHQVLDEALRYDLVHIQNEQLKLSEAGINLISVFDNKGIYDFNLALIPLMERHYHAFYHLISFCYNANPEKNGLLILPVYSPLKLNCEKHGIKTTSHIISYMEMLAKHLEQDIRKYLNREEELSLKNQELLEQLVKAGLLSEERSNLFDPKNYNKIIMRIRKFWLKFFLKEIYHYPYDWPAFEVWTYRAKQIGILHTTSFYPGFSGNLFYPLSVILNGKASEDFLKVFTYPDGNALYIHHPNWDDIETQNEFADALAYAYFDIRSLHKSYFVNLADAREIVCYKLKISEYVFEKFLNCAYKLSIAGKLNKISISLEADRLPHETNAMYLKREPVMVDGKYKNIIAIDLTGKQP